MLYLLNKENPMSVIDIADRLKISHPAVVQFADQMQKKKLLLAKKDKNDARKRLLELSNKGKTIFNQLQPILTQVKKSTHELIESTGVNLLYALDKMEKQLAVMSMYDRVQEGLKNDIQKSVKIVPYHNKYRNDFKTLNEEWLLQYFKIEKEDIKILNQPEAIVMDGGAIFFAISNNKVIGTVALSAKAKQIYELNKMAVTGAYQGNKIGARLIKKALAFAKDKGAKEVYLETNRNLFAAIHLYEKSGFKEEKFSSKSSYKRSNLKMVLKLNNAKALK